MDCVHADRVDFFLSLDNGRKRLHLQTTGEYLYWGVRVQEGDIIFFMIHLLQQIESSDRKPVRVKINKSNNNSIEGAQTNH